MIKRIQFFLWIFTIVAFLFMMNSDALAREKNPTGKSNTTIAKPGVDKVTQSMINIGNWGYWFVNDGMIGHSPYTGDAGGFYPRGTAGAVYREGLVWGGIVNDPDPALPQLRVGGNTYNIGTQPGAFNMDPLDDRARVYRIRSDWRTLTAAQVINDAAEIFNVDPSNVTSAQTTEIMESYMLDWKEWPTDLGAPYYDVDGNGSYDPVRDPDGYPVAGTLTLADGTVLTGNDYPGIANADQVLWMVTNDQNPSATTQLYGSPPIGIECQVTGWAYNQPTAGLGQIVFKKFKFYNYSGFRIDSMYVSQWCDGDLGNYGDDLTGCDTTLSLMFTYNGFPADGQYANFGLAPAAVGYDFFQGPMVPSVGDTAVFDLKKVPDHINLPMTAYGYFGSGTDYTDPDLQEYDGTLQWYNLLRGFAPTTDIANPTEWTYTTGPQAGQVTKFPLSGDPVGDPGGANGDVDGNTYQPGDRRMLQCSGPFTMENGDVQEVTVAIIGGLGANNIQSVADMKSTDFVAQTVYNSLFQVVPKPPEAPQVRVAAMEDYITLDWGWNEAAVKKTEEPVIINYQFEGYNVYQLASSTSKLTDATTVKLATYDVVNGVRIITTSLFSAQYGTVVELPVQYGTDSGIKRYFAIEKDYINNRPLYRGSTYYFAVTAYNFDPDLVRDSALESAATIFQVTPQDPKPGVRIPADFGNTVDVAKDGVGEGQVLVTVVDPTALTGHNYEVFFEVDEDENSPTYEETVWGLKDVTAGTVVLGKQRQVVTLTDSDVLTVDGLDIRVSGPPLTFTKFEVVENNAGPLSPSDIGCFAFNNNGFPFLFNDRYPDGGDRPTQGVQQTTNNGKWGIATGMTAANTGTFSYFITRVTQGEARWPLIIPYDWEIRFTYEADNYGYEPNAFVTGASSGGTLMTVPFELWRTGIGTPDDQTDDVRLFPYLIDSDADGVFNISTIDHGLSGADNDPETDWFYWVLPNDLSPGEAGYNAIANDVVNNTAGHVYLGSLTAGTDAMRRMVLVNWNGGSVADASYPANLNSAMPEQGTVFRITTAKPNQVGDKFTFTAPAVTQSTELAKADVEKINVFPNPYYGDNPLEPSRFTHFVTFNHLPKKATFRIFNLGGSQVRMLEKDDDSQFFRWDLLNENGLPVASGVYIVYIDMPDLGKTKVLKVFIVQPQQILEFF